MRVKITKEDFFVGLSLHKFPESVRDLGDYAILFLYWDIRVFKKNNPWRYK